MNRSMDYPFTKCFNPKQVMNKYTQELVSTSCGVCPACLTQRANLMSFLCEQEQLQHKYCMFVTLKYDEYSCPFLDVVFKSHGVLLFDATKPLTRAKRLPLMEGKLFAHIDESYISDGSDLKLVVKSIMAKSLLGDQIRPLSKLDLRNFIKRFRAWMDYNVYKPNNIFDEIRYYAVGEYGPKHLRPHYHLLLFFDQTLTLQNFGKALHSSWSFGSFDYSFARKHASQYVARYINSTYGYPSVYAHPALRPFALHSNYFATTAYRDKKKEIFKTPLEQLVKLSVSTSDGISCVSPWRSFQRLFFPKCSGFGRAGHEQRVDTYLVLFQIKRFYPIVSQSPKAASRLIYDDIRKCVRNDVTRFFNDNDMNYFSEDEDIKRCYQNRIYSIILLSRHFIDFCLDGVSMLTAARPLAEQYVKRIEDYYSKKALLRLHDFYSSQCDFLKEGNNIEQLVNFYDDFTFDPTLKYDFELKEGFLNSIGLDHGSYDCSNFLENLQLYKDYKSDQLFYLSKMQKHKEQNDSSANWMKFFYVEPSKEKEDLLNNILLINRRNHIYRYGKCNEFKRSEKQAFA